jgi:1-hydroxycarotenoid 3,4-desaturase
LAKVIIIGGGVGGLSAAIELASKGVEIDLIDPNSELGGKIHQTNFNGQMIDSGPTVLTMKWVFESLFNRAGANLADEVKISKLSTIARHLWSKTEQLDLFSDRFKSAEAIENFSSKVEADRFLSFCNLSSKVFQALEPGFINNQRPKIGQSGELLGFAGIKLLGNIGAFRSFWYGLGRQFKDPRLQQLFARYSTYVGSSPWSAPSTLMLIPHVEMSGVWTIKGGMIELTRAMVKLCIKLGVRFHKNYCEEILTYKGHASGVRLQDGYSILAENVIFNGDVSAIANGLLGPMVKTASKKIQPSERSLSALTWVLQSKTNGLQLSRHNVFFNENYQNEFTDIFKKQQLPRKPTVYLCAQDRDDCGLSVKNQLERLFILVNAPPLGDNSKITKMEYKKCQSSAVSLLNKCGLSIETPPETWIQKTAVDFHQRYPSTGGSLYGSKTHGWLTPFRRQASRSKIPGLYLSGGSTHPGPGIPMATISGRLAAEALMVDLGLINQ